MPRPWLLVALLLPAALCAQEQPGHAASAAPPPPLPARSTAPATPPVGVPPLTPEEALAAIRVQPGFAVEPVAAEPLVDHPVALDVDADGRLWVVEMTGFMLDVEGGQSKAPGGRVVVLEDTDGDGRMDRRTVFLDRLGLPRAVKVVGKGALVGDPPHLWYCPDENGDLKADRKEPVTSDYFLPQDNPEMGPNSPMWAMDNWIHQAMYSTRLRYASGRWLREASLEKGQWGLTQDDVGRLFYNTNRDQLRGDLVPSHYYLRNPSSVVRSGVNSQIATDGQTVWPAHPTPNVTEGFRPGVLRPDGTLKEFTAACGPVIYRGDNFPREFFGNAFVCEPAANLIKRNILHDEGGVVQSRQAYTGEEFLASTDERFRPVNLLNAPDGTLLVVDMCKGIIVYKEHMSPYLKQRLTALGLVDPPRPMGRIWRVIHRGRRRGPVPRLSGRSSAELVSVLSHPVGWWRDTAQRLLVERGDREVVPALAALARSGGPRLARLHSLWTLEGLGALDAQTLLAVISDPDHELRRAAVRLSEHLLRSGDPGEILGKVVSLAADPRREVRVQVALSLGESRGPEAREALFRLLSTASSDVLVVDAVLSGLRGRELGTIQRLLAEPAWARSDPGRQRTLRLLASCLARSRDAASMERLLALLAPSGSTVTWKQAHLLDGLAVVVRASRMPPIQIPHEPTGFATLARTDDPWLSDRARDVLDSLTWPGRATRAIRAPARPLTDQEAARAERGRALYAQACLACHQADGTGQWGRAPPLLESQWALGSPEALVRIVLDGVKGPILVQDREWSGEMPALGALSDEELAAILTYVRRAWGHGAAAVGPAEVAAIRRAVRDRRTPWTAAELEGMR